MMIRALVPRQSKWEKKSNKLSMSILAATFEQWLTLSLLAERLLNLLKQPGLKPVKKQRNKQKTEQNKKQKQKKKEKQVIDRNPILRRLLVSNANLHYCLTFEQMLVQQASWYMENRAITLLMP